MMLTQLLESDSIEDEVGNSNTFKYTVTFFSPLGCGAGYIRTIEFKALKARSESSVFPSQ